MTTSHTGTKAGPSLLIGLIGTGVGPSLTPAMHELEGKRHGLAYVYRTINLEPGEDNPERLYALMTRAWRLGFDGLNITHPVKQTIVPLLDELAPTALAVGAVNTVVFRDGKTVGHNTDVTAFGATIDDARYGRDLGRTVLIGAGGAGAAVAGALATRSPSTLAIVDIDQSRANALASRAGTFARGEPQSALPQLVKDADTVVNATPLGMAAHPGAAFDPALLNPAAFVVDVVYRPVRTQLVQQAEERGCQVLTGLGMAMHQAADAFEIFTGEAADRRAMLADLTDLVTAEAAATSAHAAPMKGQ